MISVCIYAMTLYVRMCGWDGTCFFYDTTNNILVLFQREKQARPLCANDAQVRFVCIKQREKKNCHAAVYNNQQPTTNHQPTTPNRS